MAALRQAEMVEADEASLKALRAILPQAPSRAPVRRTCSPSSQISDARARRARRAAGGRCQGCHRAELDQAREAPGQQHRKARPAD
jgi:hypothetical protein